VLSPYPREGASVRFRVLQFLPELERAGIEVVFLPFMSAALFGIRRRFGWAMGVYKALLALRDALVLLTRLLARGRSCRAVLVHREASPIGPALLERLLAALGRRVVYDLDDSVYAPPTSGIDQRLLSGPAKYHSLFRISRRVIAGNATIASYAAGFTDPARIVVIPTGIDAARWRGAPRAAEHRPVVIGWVGNWGNAFYLESLRDPLAALARDRRFVLKVIGGDDVLDLDLPCPVERVRWSLEREVEDLRDVDIGIMPLRGGSYDEGKCGFKIIQFFAMCAPAVATPVGVNSEIIRHGENGFLARDDAEWVEALRLLVDDPERRRTMGAAGRRLVEERYSTAVLAPALIEAVTT
jgi:glycosyltransferase involved in cell wall biosynthesis